MKALKREKRRKTKNKTKQNNSNSNNNNNNNNKNLDLVCKEKISRVQKNKIVIVENEGFF